VRLRSLVLIPATVLALAGVACNGDDGGGSNPPATGDGIAVGLKDFVIAPATSTSTSGTVAFDITNDGPSVHEFEVLATDTAPDALPVDSGVVQTEGDEIVDEVENIAPATSTSLSVDLAPGSYVFICNIPGHYEAGMHAGFTVT
jgi:uncharacterized cupredoxin-like copper-binding protein